MSEIIGSIGNGAPANDDAAQQAAAAQRAREREEAAARIRSYAMARIVNPSAARKMPDVKDVLGLLDERTHLYEHLAQMQAQAIHNVALILHASGRDRLEVPESAIQAVEGCAIAQSTNEETGAMVLELVRPPAPDGEVTGG